LPGAAVHAKDPDTPGATRAPMLLQHPDQYRWPGYTYLVATRIDLPEPGCCGPGSRYIPYRPDNGTWLNAAADQPWPLATPARGAGMDGGMMPGMALEDVWI